jgi:hypothetical protein
MALLPTARTSTATTAECRRDALDHIRLIRDFGSALDVVSSSSFDDVSGAAAVSGDRASVTWPFTSPPSRRRYLRS